MIADCHLETGGFASAVLAEESDDLGLVDAEGDVIDDLAAAVDLHKPGHIKEFHPRLSRPSTDALLGPSSGAQRPCGKPVDNPPRPP